jgi:hypothetical protein
MARVTPSEHYKRYLFLRAAWLDFDALYGLLPVHKQWQVHELYQPSCELTRGALLGHVRALSALKPGLAHQAGKHVRLMEKVFRYVSEELGIPRSEWRRALGTATYRASAPASRWEAKDGRRYVVSGIAQPELDTAKFAKALLALAEQLRIGESDRDGVQ